jgi:hypothetical protein
MARRRVQKINNRNSKTRKAKEKRQAAKQQRRSRITEQDKINTAQVVSRFQDMFTKTNVPEQATFDAASDEISIRATPTVSATIREALAVAPRAVITQTDTNCMASHMFGIEEEPEALEALTPEEHQAADMLSELLDRCLTKGETNCVPLSESVVTLLYRQETGVTLIIVKEETEQELKNIIACLPTVKVKTIAANGN